ncbi:MAG: amidohydrolase family protein [Planctomycetota bacterium]
MIELGGQILTVERSKCFLRAGVIRFDEGGIESIAWDRDVHSAADGGDLECLIMPGMVDAHLHLPQFPIIGAHGMPLLEWLQRVVFPTEATWMDPRYAAQCTRGVAQQLLRHGTTSVAAYATVHGPATAAAMRVLAEIGIGGLVGQVWMNTGMAEELHCPVDQLIDETAALIDAYPPGARLSAAITPRFALSCDANAMQAAGKLARETGAWVQTHLSETQDEVARVRECFGGRDYVQVYQDFGLCGPRSVLGHGIHLSESEVRRLVDADACIAHCPTANSFLRSGAMPWVRWKQAGLRCVLGSDVGAGYERSMVRVARAMIETASRVLPADQADLIPTAAQAFFEITRGACETFGWLDRGVLKAGCRADVLRVRPDRGWIRPGAGDDTAIDPLSRLLFSWDDRWIDQVWLGGRRKI